jgi:hypothetical protein
MSPVNLPVALSVHRTTRNVFARSILGVNVEYFPVNNSLTAKSVLAGEELVTTYSIST